jgi:pyruvate formate lyase activating enzyme
MTEDFYQRMSSAQLAPVLRSIKILQEQGIWIELINLVVPTWNDSREDLLQLTQWIAETLGPDVPLHFSRFWPQHQLQNLPPTPPETLDMAWAIAKQQGLNYVYVGNVPGHPANNTYCPVDHKLLIERVGYQVLQNNIIDGKCKFCQTKIPGLWER